MKAHNAIETTLVVEELSDADLTAINGGTGYVTTTPLGSGLGQVGDGVSTILNPVVGGLFALVGG